MPQVTSSSDVAVSLMYIHPGSNAEVDFLFGPGGDRKRYKRRRGERGPTRNQFATIGEPKSGCCSASQAGSVASVDLVQQGRHSQAE